MEGESYINRIVGTPKELPEAHDVVKEDFEYKFENQEVKEYEKEPSQEQKEIITSVISSVSAWLQEKYGIEPIDIELEHIHIYDIWAMPEEKRNNFKTAEGVGRGAYIKGSMDTEKQKINLFDSGHFDNFALANVLTHELMHAYSFKSRTILADVEKRKVTSIPRRSGLTIIEHTENKKLTLDDVDTIIRERPLSQVNEAVTEELSIRFMKAHIDDIPHLEEAKAAILKDLKDTVEAARLKFPGKKMRMEDIQTGISYGDADAPNVITRDDAAYPAYRQKFVEKMQHIFINNRDTFNSSEEVFDFFAKRYFDGRLLEIARLIDSTEGKGAFAEYAHSTATIGKNSQKR